MTTQHSILVADDDPVVRRVLVRVVKRVAPDVHIVEAVNGAEALAALPHYAWLAIITDYTMPEVSGLEVVSAAHAEAPDAPIIVISAHAEVEPGVLAAGAQYFVQKPFTIEQLMNLLRAVIAPH